MNREQIERLKVEDIKTWIWQLPITLTETVEDTKFYFSGCNEIHKHNYEAAKSLFIDGLQKVKNLHSRQLLSFNLAYCLFKLDDQECLKLWKYTDYDEHYKTLANFNMASVTFYNSIASKLFDDRVLQKINESMSYFD